MVNAARVSYGKFVTTLSARDEQLVKYLVEHDHTSPFEHNQLSFRIKAPIYVVRQWMRHRMNSYNEISYRYVKSALEFYVPTVWRDQDTKNRQGSIGGAENPAYTQKFQDGLKVITQVYEDLLAQGVCREQARGILPVCTYSEFIFTCNLHSLMHFIKLRTHPGAQYEIRTYAQAMAVMAREHFPVSMAAFGKKHHLPGFE